VAALPALVAAGLPQPVNPALLVQRARADQPQPANPALLAQRVPADQAVPGEGGDLS